MGAVLGLYAGFSPGPLLALTLSETFRHGRSAGMKVALAPVATDLPIILATVFVLSRFSGFHEVLGGVSLVGGGFLVYLAWGCMRTEGGEVEVNGITTGSFVRGVLANVLSPHPYLFWFSVGGPLIIRAWEQNATAPLAFVGGFYTLLVGSKMLLAVLTGRFRAFLSGRVYLYIMRVLGLMLLALALTLFQDGLELLNIL